MEIRVGQHTSYGANPEKGREDYPRGPYAIQIIRWSTTRLSTRYSSMLSVKSTPVVSAPAITPISVMVWFR